MAIRIAVVGAHGTGKTMLVQRLADAFGLPVIPEASRIVAEIMGISNMEGAHLGPEFQWACLQTQERNEYRHASYGFVADRGWPDYAAYPIALGSFRHTELSGYLLAVRTLARASYDIVVQPLIEFPLENDGFRHSKISTQSVVDELIWMITPGLVTTNQVRVSGSTEERVAKVRDYVRRKVDE